MDINALLHFLPQEEQNLNRLAFIKNNSSKPRIAVFGKYNHGKSTLLNALIGEEFFKAADKRETVENRELEQEKVIWIDTPGLDADVNRQDDAKAIKGAFEVADYLFLVHQAQAGELDKYELDVFLKLARQDKNYSQKMFLIITQVDQKSPDDVAIVERKIREQLMQFIDLQQLEVIKVSAQRYLRGIQENKSIFCERSNINELFSLTGKLVEQIDAAREKELKRLKSKILLELRSKTKWTAAELMSQRAKAMKEKAELQRDIITLSQALV